MRWFLCSSDIYFCSLGEVSSISSCSLSDYTFSLKLSMSSSVVILTYLSKLSLKLWLMGSSMISSFYSSASYSSKESDKFSYVFTGGAYTEVMKSFNLMAFLLLVMIGVREGVNKRGLELDVSMEAAYYFLIFLDVYVIEPFSLPNLLSSI